MRKILFHFLSVLAQVQFVHYTVRVFWQTNVLNHRVHILVEMKQGQCNCPLSWSVHCNFTGEGKCNERRWACTPHPHQPGLILPSSLNVRQKAAVATLCTLCSELCTMSLQNASVLYFAWWLPSSKAKIVDFFS
jgi:hypothetical protein